MKFIFNDWTSGDPFPIALDVDGVLADFTGPVYRYAQIMTGRLVPWEKLHHYDLSNHWPEIKTAMREHWRARGFCATIPVIAASQTAVQTLYKLVSQDNIRYVTTPMPGSDFWIPERTKWLEHYFGARPSQIIYTDNKNVDTTSRLLIDDRPENVVSWAQQGKSAILIRQPFNFEFELPRDLRIAEAQNIVEAVTLLLDERAQQGITQGIEDVTTY